VVGRHDVRGALHRRDLRCADARHHHLAQRLNAARRLRGIFTPIVMLVEACSMPLKCSLNVP
jgi:hypothetical protein